MADPDPAPDRPRGRRRWAKLLRPLLAVLLLSFVASTLPWEDRLEWTAADETTTAFAGVIEGDWAAAAVSFRFEAVAEPPSTWPAELQAAARSGEAARIARPPAGAGDPGPEGHFGWKPSMQRVFRELEASALARAMAFFVLGVLICATRWWRLLRLAGCATRWVDAFRLTFLGLFFNLIVPGLTGGDLPKAVLAARENPGRRADAVVSVLVDRVLGLLALVALAGLVIVASGDAFTELRVPVALVIGAAVLGAVVYVNPTLRRLLHVDRMASRLPFADRLRSLDRAALAYARHPLELTVAVLLSFLNHGVVIVAVQQLGTAFGLDAFGVALRDYFVVVPVGNVVTALPLSPGGWGIGEAAYKVLFEMVGGDGDLGVAVSITFRLCQLALGLLGGLFLLMPGGKDELAQARAEAARGA
jgi:uncharacterized protein (TIRG00374 family)